MKLRLLTLAFAAIFLLPKETLSQETHGDPEFWFLLLNHYEINEKWTVGNEVHIRRTDWFSDQKQFILRPFVNFKPGESVIYTAGYSYISTEPYGKYPLPATLPEHNFWEQVTVNQSLGKTTLSHRYRMEHRYQGNQIERPPGGTIERDGYNFSNRFRYRLTLRKPISEDYFIHIFDELWVSADSKFKQASYNQNWIYLGFGRNVGNGNVQLAYLHQHASSDGIVERHPSLQVTFQYDF
ncbi:DUF2490 domain-containing protein [Ekhidna sp.]|uniref:DUF2490 domain-containing protein n=1 Tax=Ekhidna sp. TaxID=2608089 RepID=UPI0032EBA147